MIKCAACGTTNIEGSQYCDECGNPLNTANNSEIPIRQVEYIEPSNVQMASVTSVGIPLIIEEPKFKDSSLVEKKDEQLQAKGAKAKLVIERGVSVGAIFQITSNESYIGRWDADNGIFPDIDLDVHDPEAKVSRRHARIKYYDGQFVIEDLGSTNGTFVNRGRRLIPGNPHILSDGDEIIVGKTFLRFKIL